MPIDIAFGTVKLYYEDISIPGKVPLVWDRRYSTALLEKPASPLGHGWTCRYYATLAYRDSQFEFVTSVGGTEIFPNPSGAFEKGEVIRNLGAFLEIFRQGRRYIVQSWNVETGEVWRYCFEPGMPGKAWKLSSIEDVTGQGVDLTWDAAGRLDSVRQGLERRELRLAYDKKGQIERLFLQDKNGERHLLMEYGYDANRQQIEARDAANFADRYEYDAQGRLTREIVKDGGVFDYRYDDKSRCVLRTGLNHYNEKGLRYLDGIRVTEVTDSYGRKFTYQHLPSGQAVLEVDPLGGKRATEYDSHGRIVAKTDATGATTSYVYDQQGNRASVIDALGNQTTFTYNEHHQPLSMTDGAGYLWRRAYDSTNRLVETMDPIGNRWLFGYDDEGNVAEVINPKGDRKQQRYGGGILQVITDWMGKATQFTFDAFGRVTKRRGALGEDTYFRYDVMGNPVQVTLPDGATLAATYDQAGNLTSFKDANGYVTRWRYGPCRRLLERTDPVGGIISYVWGSERGWLQQIINENAETYTFFRDGRGNIVREVSFDGVVRSFQYDADSHSIAYTNANGETIAFERDALHRIVGQTLPNGERINFAFDPVGNLIAAVNADIAVSFERDPLGRIVREVQGKHWVASRYDAVGNLTRTETSLGHIVDYEIDANGFVSKLTTHGNKCMEFERNDYGQETVRRMPGGAYLEQRYDEVGRLIEQRVIAAGTTSGLDSALIPSGAELVRRSYVYDPNGILTSIVDGHWGRIDYMYDPAERLLKTLRERGTSEQFEYDQVGNITRIRLEGKTVSDDRLIFGAGNRLLQKGSTHYAYDAEGRRITKIEEADTDDPKIWQYEWSALNRLVGITCPDGSVWRYQYDALARRVSKTGPNVTQQFIWDKDVMIQHVRDEFPLSTWIFDTTSFAPLATLQNSLAYVAINDHIGTPKEFVDEFGRIVLMTSASVWGQRDATLREGKNSVECPVGFQGQWYDTESNLFFNRFRYYDAECGRYISQDPISLLGDLNLSRYTINPINWIDPLGLCDETVGDNDVAAMRERLQQGVPADQVVPDHYLIVRGGTGDMPPPGTVISGSAGATPTQAGAGVPHGQVRQTTAGEIRAAGGTVTYVPEPTRSGDMNYRHVNIVEGSGPGPAAFPAQPSPNPAPKSSRVR